MDRGLSVSSANPALSQTRSCADELLALPDFPAAKEVAEIRKKIAGNSFNLVVAGEFKRGKSSFINALIGAEVLPVGVVPLTAIATLVGYGEQPSAEVLFRNGERLGIPPQELANYVTEKGNPENEKNVAEVWLAYPSGWLKSGVRLVDTPGIGSIYRHNSDETYRFLPKADAVLFLLSVDQPVGQAEYDFLKQVQEYAGKIFFLLNKADLLREDDLQESIEFSRRVLSEAMGRTVPVFPVSARLALEVHGRSDAALLSRSGFPAFTCALSRFLMEEKGNALAVAAAKNLLRLVTQARFNSELARASLATPLEEWRGKIEAFERKRAEMGQEKHDFSILLEAEVRDLADRQVTADVDAFKENLVHEVEAGARAHFGRVRSLPSRELHEELQRYAMEIVRNSWDGFRRNEDEKVEAAFQALSGRFSTKIEEAVDELYRYSSELFSVPFESARGESSWETHAGFYYKFWEMPGSLAIMSTSLLHALPKFIGDALILDEAEKYGKELADTQAGRIRYDFAQRLDKSMRGFKVAMLERMDSTLEGIASALRRGAEISQNDAKSADAKLQGISSRIEVFDSLSKRLKQVITQAETAQA